MFVFFLVDEELDCWNFAQLVQYSSLLTAGYNIFHKQVHVHFKTNQHWLDSASFCHISKSALISQNTGSGKWLNLMCWS